MNSFFFFFSSNLIVNRIIIIITIIIFIIVIIHFLSRLRMITAAILVCQNNQTGAMLMHQKNIWV